MQNLFFGENELYLHENKDCFHINGFALSLELKQRLGATRKWPIELLNRVFSHDVTAAILVSQNNETAAVLIYQTNPVRVELFSYANAFFCFDKFA